MALAFSVAPIQGAFAGTITITAFDQGSYREDGSHVDSTRAQAIAGTHDRDYRAYFAFDVSNIPSEATAATLTLFPHPGTCNPCEDPSAPTVDFQISEVVTSYATLSQRPIGTTEGLSVYADLGDGLSYGVFTKQVNIQEPVLPIPLLDAALSDINQADGILIVGIKVIPTPGAIWDGTILAEHNDFAILEVTANLPPIADPGTAEPAHPGQTVDLDGSSSTDPDENYPLTYSWALLPDEPSGSSAFIENATAVTPSFIPDLLGEYTVELVVTDSEGLSSEPAQLTVSTFNTPPVACTSGSGADIPILLIGEIVSLDGGCSYDPEGDSFEYDWAIVSKPDESLASLVDSNSQTPSFIADVHDETAYEIQLIVTDEYGAASAPDSVVASFENLPPVADAGGNQDVFVWAIVYLDGSLSDDPNNDWLSFHWSMVSAPNTSVAVLDDPGAIRPMFTADLPGEYVISLVVNDGFVDSEPDNITILAISNLNFLIETLSNLNDAINDLDDGALRNRNMRNALTNKVNSVLSLVDQGDYEEALDKLTNDLQGKTDGCAVGGGPDRNDWIRDCDAQANIHSLILDAIGLINDILGSQ
jgi:hypothetical protein